VKEGEFRGAHVEAVAHHREPGRALAEVLHAAQLRPLHVGKGDVDPALPHQLDGDLAARHVGARFREVCAGGGVQRGEL